MVKTNSKNQHGEKTDATPLPLSNTLIYHKSPEELRDLLKAHTAELALNKVKSDPLKS